MEWWNPKGQDWSQNKGIKLHNWNECSIKEILQESGIYEKYKTCVRMLHGNPPRVVDLNLSRDLTRKGSEEDLPCSLNQGLQFRPVRSNRRPLVAVYWTDLIENRWKLVKFKSKFKIACVNGSDRFDRKPVETGQIQIQIQNRMSKRFRLVYRPVWLVTGQIQFFFGLNSNARKVY